MKNFTEPKSDTLLLCHRCIFVINLYKAAVGFKCFSTKGIDNASIRKD